jgi:hypothetical protein
MDKQALMREVDKLEPSQRETYEAVKVHAKNLEDALAFAKGTLRMESGTTITTIRHVMQDPEKQAQVDHLLPIERKNFEMVFFHQGLGKPVSFDEAMEIAKSGKVPDTPEWQGYRDHLTNARKGTD